MLPVIEVDHVTKEFRLGQLTSLGQSLRNGLNRVLGRPVERRAPFKALDDVSLTIEQGEVLGIIGHNGAGKSTLLKILAGISRPTLGKVTVRGRVAPLIEVGAGLVPDLTGRENILLNACILGMKREEIKRKFDEIVAFAELEQFIETPIKRYSTGMQVRLGFAIATAATSDVLIVDEVLAVGDLAFQRKCYDRIESLISDSSRTILLVSHNLRQIERLCTKALMLRSGAIAAHGKVKTVCDTFVAESNSAIAHNRQSGARLESIHEFRFLSCQLLDERGEGTGAICSGQAVRFRFHIASGLLLRKVTFTVAVHTTDMFFISAAGSDAQIPACDVEPGEYSVECSFKELNLTPGVYAVHLSVEGGSSAAPIFKGDNLMSFEVRPNPTRTPSSSERFGMVFGEVSWAVPKPVSTERGDSTPSGAETMHGVRGVRTEYHSI